jgi:hypothetical protein
MSTTNVTNQVTSLTTVTNITNITNLSTKDPIVLSEDTYYKYYQNILDDISKCECCKIHNINRPLIYKPFIEVPFRIDVPTRPSNTFIDTFGVSKIICNCNCRINARMICRNHPRYSL